MQQLEPGVVLFIVYVFIFLALYFFLIRPNALRKKREKELLEKQAEPEVRKSETDCEYEKKELSHCPFCGATLAEGQIFCEQCGRRLDTFYQKDTESSTP